MSKSKVAINGVEKPLLRNKLLVGKHQGPDYAAEPDSTGRRPNKRYAAGDVVLDVVNLEHKLGSDKFRCLDGAPIKPIGRVQKKLAPSTVDEEAADTLSNQSPEELFQMAKDLGLEVTGDEDAEALRSLIREAM